MMIQQKKSEQMKIRILNTALTAFNESGYQETSMNQICTLGNFSKGIIYRYFNDKDSLYLACIEKCFDDLVGWVTKHWESRWKNPVEGILRYFKIRSDFFEKNPEYVHIFLEGIIFPPENLISGILVQTKKLDEINKSIMEMLLQNAKLKSNISVESAVEMLLILIAGTHLHFRRKKIEDWNFQEYEKNCRFLLQVFLSGILGGTEDI